MSANGFAVPLKGPGFLAIAVLELLRRDPALQSIVGPGNFFRRNVLSEIPDLPSWPAIVVTSMGLREDAKPSFRLTTHADIGVLFCFSALNVNLSSGNGDDDSGTADLLLYIKDLIRFDLVNAYVRGRFAALATVPQLVTREEFREMRPEPVKKSQTEVGYALGIQATYVYKAELIGRRVAGQVAA